MSTLMGLKTEVVVGDETLNFEMLLLDVCLLMVSIMLGFMVS